MAKECTVEYLFVTLDFDKLINWLYENRTNNETRQREDLND